MADSLEELLEGDREARDFFDSLPLFIQDQIRESGQGIQSKAQLSGIANQAMREGLLLNQYKPMFEDETDSRVDLL